MKILSISSILPIPGLLDANDFVFSTYTSYLVQFPEDEIIIIRPTQYKTNIRKVITRRTDLDLIKGRMTWQINNFQVEIYPFLSACRARDLHAFLSFSILFFNNQRLKALLRRKKFDIIHAQCIYPDGMLAFLINKKYGIPYVITTHKELFYFRFPFSRYFAKRILKQAYHIVPINHMNSKYFKGIGLNNIKIVPLGFNTNFYKPQKKFNRDIVKIITVCRLLPYKNVKSILFAIARLVRKYNISYTIIGCGPELTKLQKIIASNNLGNYVSFIEQLPHNQLADEIFNHDIFILTSYVETFGRVYFEAMAMGIPVICSKNSGIYGYYKDMEEGVTVIHNNIDDITDKLEKLIANQELRIKIGKQGQELVKEYTWRNIVSNIHKIYFGAIKQYK